MQQKLDLNYRPEIDGLRAIAVLAVVFYHADFAIEPVYPFRGGFIGVDIFFVISGYLITKIILSELNAGTFSFSYFYERRIRRIVPALSFVILAVTPVAYYIMLPAALKQYAYSTLASIFFSSNIWFFFEDRYTAEPSLFKPMLHTWSLSVEEQFYILAPIAIYVIWKFGNKYMTTLFVVALLVSLQFAHTFWRIDSDAVFFLLPARAWELLAGCVLARLEFEHGGRRFPHVFGRIMPIIGVFLIAYAIFQFEDTMRHPSYWTVIPIAGTMILIWFTRPGELVTDVLSSRPMQAIGLISYSLYLWHWPILTLARIDNQDLSMSATLGLVAFSFVAAAFTYRFVEQPFRKHKRHGKQAAESREERIAASQRQRPLVFGTFAATSAIGAGCMAFLIATDGAAYRVGAFENYMQIGGYTHMIEGRECWSQGTQGLGKHCVFENPSAEKNIYVVGDSHSAVLYRSVYEHFHATHQIEFLPECVFFARDTIGVKTDGSLVENTCGNEQLAYLKDRPGGIVIIGQRLTLRLTGVFPAESLEGVLSPRYFPAENTAATAKETLTRFVESLSEVLEMGHKVVMLGPAPEHVFDIPKHYARAVRTIGHFNFDSRIHEHFRGLPTDDYYKRNGFVHEALHAIDHPEFRFVDIAEALCEPGGICATANKDGVFYSDDDHLSYFGIETLMPLIKKAILD